ncbi:MAG: hypothetical protein LBK96_06925 [Prevotellaceae bacterium]|nr:hypothetical protein [Prevotellaceae bacterium]
MKRRIFNMAFMILAACAVSSPASADGGLKQANAELTKLSAKMEKFGDAHAALVSHGTYEDTRNDPDLWSVQMLNNYRNCLMSCLWFPVSMANRNKIAAEYGIAQGLSDGEGDFVGPVDMKPDMLAEVIGRFLKNVKEKKQRTKYLDDN